MYLLLLAYLVLVHTAVVADLRVLEWAALTILSANLLYPALARNVPWAWLALAACAAGGMAFVLIGGGRAFLYAVPVLIAAALFWLFARSLLPGERPLIARVASRMRGPLTPRVERYTKAVTQFWTIFFAGFALANLLLALFASPVVWSSFANFINYLIVAAVFVGEWFFRIWYLRSEETLTWREYASQLMQLDLRRL